MKKKKKNSKKTNKHQNAVEYIAGKSFYSFHLRKSKVQCYLPFADLSDIFLIQSFLYFQRSPVTQHRRITYGM